MSPALESVLAWVVVATVSVLVAVFTEKGGGRRGIAFALAWILPGAGHAVMGKPWKGLFFFVVLAATYVAGAWIVGFRPVSFDDNPFYYMGQFGSGAALAMAKVVSCGKAVPSESLPSGWFDVGLLYVCVAGLLNLVVVLNILDVPLPAPRKESGA